MALMTLTIANFINSSHSLVLFAKFPLSSIPDVNAFLANNIFFQFTAQRPRFLAIPAQDVTL
jgi:hypothetical protein